MRRELNTNSTLRCKKLRFLMVKDGKKKKKESLNECINDKRNEKLHRKQSLKYSKRKPDFIQKILKKTTSRESLFELKNITNDSI